MTALKKNTNQPNREGWLMLVALEMKPHIERLAEIKIPPFRVSCSFPDKNGKLGGRSLTRGQCWRAELSADGHAEIFINPVLDEIDPIVPILAHEIIHAGLPDAGHRKTFEKAALAIGLLKPVTTSVASPAFWEWCQPIIDRIPDYPHGKLNARRSYGANFSDPNAPQPLSIEEPLRFAPVAAPKKQTNRQMKCECQTCGYIARTSRKWLEIAGPPICPVGGHGVMSAA